VNNTIEQQTKNYNFTMENMELVIAGLTGAIGKMLVMPANDLYDIDAYIDDEFGSDDDSFLMNGPIYTKSTDAMTVHDDNSSDGGSSSRAIDEELREVCTLDLDTDPFAPRTGKTLLWRNVNMTLVRLQCKYHF
jgi:hypothetical protein